MNSFRSFLIGLAAVGVLAIRAPACLHFIEDESSPLSPPAPLSLRDRLLQHHSRQEWQTRVDQWRPIADKAFAFTSQNNLAAALAHVGQYDEAMRRFQTIERVSPGHEFTAYNIATVYELQGDLPQALRWVVIGIEREKTAPRRHPLDNTEWLHVRILQARLSAQSAPQSANATSVAGVDFGDRTQPQPPKVSALDSDGLPFDAATVSRALWEQTHERLEFAPAPDPVVADLLFDVANFAYYRGQNEEARGVYELALQYGPRRAALARKRLDVLEGKPNLPLIFGGLALFGCSILGLTWRKGQLEKSAWNALPVKPLDEIAPQRKAVCIDWKNRDGDDGNVV